MVAPQAPMVVNVYGRLMAAPPAVTIPYCCGALDEATPPPVSNVATRFVVFPAPTFFNVKLIVTVSPGSTTPLVGRQVSVFRTSPVAEITGNGTLKAL